MGRTILDNEQQYVQLSGKELCNVRLIRHESGWALRVPYLTRRPTLERHWRDQSDLRGMGFVTIRGQPAVTAARQLLPLINGYSARKTVVDHAVELAGTWTDSSNGFAYSLAQARALDSQQYSGDPGSIDGPPAPIRLALEVSVHESGEQRVMDGQLGELERTWRDAEEVTSIADSLLIPGRIERTLFRLRNRNPLA